MIPTQELHDAGQSIWLDNITRALLDSGTLERYIAERSVTGLTSNPTIFDKAIEAGSDYDDEIVELKQRGLSSEEVFHQLAIGDLHRAADLFSPAHAQTDCLDGWVSLEVSPLLARDTSATIDEVRLLHQQLLRRNIFVKIPGTAEGIPAIEECIFEGIPINVTLLFSPEQYIASAEAYMRGIERRIEAGLNPSVWSVASLFVSRWDTAVTDVIPNELRDQLGIAVAGQAYKDYHALLNSDRWGRLANAGARPQRLLWASTSTKNPDAPDTLYVSALAAPFTINTMPEKTLAAFADHGTVGDMMAPGGGDSHRILADVARAGIDVDALATKLQSDGTTSFNESWKRLLACIDNKHHQLATVHA